MFSNAKRLEQQSVDPYYRQRKAAYVNDKSVLMTPIHTGCINVYVMFYCANRISALKHKVQPRFIAVL